MGLAFGGAEGDWDGCQLALGKAVAAKGVRRQFGF